MADQLHSCLTTLSSVEFDDVPTSSDDLKVLLSSTLSDTHTLVTSIPPPTALPPALRLPTPPSTSASDLQKEWKPIKLSAKDNPHNIAVFKLPAKDGKGTWFARRSVHTAIPFRRFLVGLQREFSVPKEKGPVRGIGMDEKLVETECEIGKATVYKLSAQFPGPSAPREFVEGVLTSTAHADEMSGAVAEENDEEKSREGKMKQFTLVSKPVKNHPECPDRQGYVRGVYESVEFVRELPVQPTPARTMSSPSLMEEGKPQTGRKRGKTVNTVEDIQREAGCDRPVEWIMITRSDPGGNVPRWMVERGTPGGIVGDANKFIDWASKNESLDHDYPAETVEKETLHGELAARDEDLKEKTKVHLAENRKSAGAAVASDTQAIGELSASRGSVQEALDRQRSQVDGSWSPQPETQQVNVQEQEQGYLGAAFSRVTAGMTSLAASAMSTSSAQPTPPSSPSNGSDISDDEKGAPLSPVASSTKSLQTACEEDNGDADSLASFATAVTDGTSPDLDLLDTSRPNSITASTTSSKEADKALASFLKEKAKLEAKLEKDKTKHASREARRTERHLRELEKKERKYKRQVEKRDERKRREEEKQKEREKKVGGKEGGAGPREGGKGRGDGWTEVEQLKKVVEALTRENLELREKVEVLEKGRGDNGVGAVEGKTA